MTSRRRKRNPTEERHERDRFVLLQHIYTLTQATPGTLLPERRIWEALAFSETEALPLLKSLRWAGYLEEDVGGFRIGVTRKGIDYIERHAGRRQSVRLVK